ncbi:MAG: bifunctional phosphoglucose/phosphomannose isomerase [Candidatus Neomarinimicrobiota bacterium]
MRGAVLAENFRSIDQDDMFGLIYNFPDQMDEAMEIGRKIKPHEDYKSDGGLAIAGMGGSAIAGDMMAFLISLASDIPVTVTRNYRLPPWVDDTNLVILLSYSGNTEETLSCLDDALNRKAKLVGITSGGRLKRRLKGRSDLVITIPPGLPPRASLGYLVIPGLYFLRRIGLVSADVEVSLSAAAENLRFWRNEFSEPHEKNLAYTIARTIYDSVPVIYGVADETSIVALRWRTQLEENGKMVAFHHSLPEMNHNEIVGFENNPDLLKKMCIIWISDSGDHPRIQRRQELTREIIGNGVKSQISVQSRGETRMERLFYLVYLGDWVSFWVAMLHRTDPTPVVRIDRLKGLLSG